MLIDSHCHLPSNLEQAQKVVDECFEQDVVKLVNIGTSIQTSKSASYIAQNIQNVYSTAAVYPHEDYKESIKSLKESLEEIIFDNLKLVAVGECGFDITEWKGPRNLVQQEELFRMHIDLAIKHHKPLVIHNRNADGQLIKVLSDYKNTDLTGVSHCFASTWETARKLLDLNFYISFSGMITYPSRKDLLEVVIKTPKDRFLVETDAPYLPPQGMRGQKNHPKYVRMTALAVSEAKSLPFETVCNFSYENTCRLFKI